jgi:hypothetical protein
MSKRPACDILPIDDCKFRRDNICIKLEKKITVDARDSKKLNCWNRMNCEHYERKEK